MKDKNEGKNFSHHSLQGQSFMAQNLTNADFSYADIRGANFRNANLTNANFQNAKGGLQPHWIAIMLAISLLLSVIAGSGAIQVGVIAMSTLSQRFTVEGEEAFGFIPAVIIFISIAVFFIVTIWRGFVLGGVALAVTISVAVPIGTILERNLAGLGTIALAVAWTPIVTLTTAIGVAVIRAISERKSFIKMVNITRIFLVLGSGIITWRILSDVTKQGNGAVAQSLDIAGYGNMTTQSAAVLIAITILFLGNFLGKKAILGDDRFSFTKSIAVALSSLGGTHFNQSNLTNANFIEATLRNTDLREAIIIRTSWFRAKKMELSRVGNSYLAARQIQQLVVSKNGKKKNFDGFDLQGINLSQANLTSISLIGANLNQANLQEANLAKSKLVQTQFADTNLTWATLTGAYIQDWGITKTSKLEGVDCKYVYMRLPTDDNRDSYRKPDDKQREFAPGEFVDFITPLINTLDLYHNQRADIHAVFASFQRLVEQYPEEKLEIIAIEKKGDDKLILRVKTTEFANLSQLSEEYFLNYNQLRKISKNHYFSLNQETQEKVMGVEKLFLGISKKIEQKFSNAQYMINQLSNLDNLQQERLKQALIQLSEIVEGFQDFTLEEKNEILEQVIIMAQKLNYYEFNQEQTIKANLRVIKGIIAELPVNYLALKPVNKLLKDISNIVGL